MTISHKAESAIEQTIEEDRGMLLNMIDNYQQNISPQIKADLGIEKICKFTPSCSEYAKQAIEEYGPVKGTVKATKRLLKCNPLTKGGYDPLV
ncbi:MAG: membrane protein insertion efficiency factor YidD [archaeon]